MELNSDIGEGGPDAQLMPYVQRVSIACGGHTGDVTSMRQALLLAKQHGVLVGAHPSYPDPDNFGRAIMAATPEQIAVWVEAQTRALQAEAEKLDLCLFHVKPHGALYNRAAYDPETAQGVIAGVRLTGLCLVALAGSPLVGWARVAGIRVLEEAFADRRYLSNGQLAPRSQPGAVIESTEAAARQVLDILAGRAFATLDGGTLTLRADTICLHADTEGAAEKAKAISLAQLSPPPKN